MTPSDQHPVPARSAAEVVGDLAYARLLPRCRLRQILPREDGGAAVRAEDLLRPLREAGTLSSWQVEQILAGRGRRLRLGSYVLIEPIGCGGMGQVYRARHRVMKRDVAVKIVGRRRKGPDGAKTVMRFRREAEAAARLCHPHVVTTHDACVDRGVLFLVMELLPGRDLHHHVKDVGPLPIPLVGEIGRQAALALHYLHERGMLHGDLKPSNLMLLQVENPRVKLLDLGLACLRKRRRRSPELQGSVDFLAPERAANPGQEDNFSDLYSLGCTLYFLVTGEVPFPGDTWTEKLLHHRLDAAPDVRALRPEVPVELATLIDRLLAKDPADRPTSAAEVAHALTAPSFRPTLNDMGTVHSLVELPPPPAVSRERRRRHRTLGLGAMMAAVAVGVLCVWAGQAFVTRARAKPIVPSPIGVQASAQRAQNRWQEGPFLVGSAHYASLEEAFAASASGDEIRVDADGAVATAALDCGNRPLTLRAVPGRRPYLVLTSRPGAAPWEGMLRGCSLMTIEGLELRADPDANGGPLLEGTDAFHLSGCRLQAPGRPVAVALRRGAELTLTDSHIEGGAVALSVEVGARPCRVVLTNSGVRADVTGIALSIWSAPLEAPGAAIVDLQGTTLEAGHLLALRGLPAGVTITARTNTFVFHHGVVNLDGRADLWQAGLTWSGSANRYRGEGAWLLGAAGRAGAGSLSSWRSLWSTDEAGSVEDPSGPTS